MRPIKLTMQAFGSYGEKTVIDFTKPTQNLFLISGDTGSGKTTIFDAMVYALYGEASSESNKKDGVELQSHFVSTFVEPFVELEFAENQGGQEYIYKVYRSPKHKKGNNKTEASASVSLEMPDGETYSANKETNTKIEEIVGLNKSQFMQVGMIAQGEFMQMLRADTRTKKAIFQKLFHTEVYEKLVNELENRKKEREKDFGVIRTQCQTEAAHILVPEDYEKAAELSDLIEEISQLKRYNSALVEQLIEELSAICDILEEDNKCLREEEKNANIVHQEALRATTEAKALNARYVDHDDAVKTLKDCEDQEASMKEKTLLADKIKNAYEILIFYRNYYDAHEKLKNRRNALDKQLEEHPSLEKKEVEAKESYEAKTDQANKKRAAFTEVETKVNDAREVFSQISIKTEEKKRKEDILKKATAEKEKARKYQDNLLAQEKTLKERAEQLKNVSADLVLWEGKQAKSLEYGKAIQALKTQETKTNAQKELAREKQEAYFILKDTYLRLDTEYKKKKQIYLDAQAGYIAEEKLKPNQPCPVCGSLDHPNPCVLSDDHREITRDLLDEMEKEVETYNKKMEKASTESGEAKTKYEESQGILERDRQSLCEQMIDHISTISMEENAQSLETANQKWSKEVNEKVSDLQKAKEEQEGIQGKLKKIDTEKEKLVNYVERVDTAFQNADKDLEAIDAVLKNLISNKTFDSLKAAEDELSKAKQAKIQAESHENEARKMAEKASKDVKGSKTLIDKYEKEMPEFIEDFNEKKASYFAKMEEKEFSEEEWQSFKLDHRQEEVNELLEEVKLHGQKKAAAQQKKKDALTAIGGKERPDLDVFQKKEEEAATFLDKIKGKREQNQRYYDANQTAWKNLTKGKDKREKISREYDTIYKLWESLAGKITGARMDIETFVLRYYLERILHNANTRFDHMSAGQYRLKMVDMEKAGEGKNKGLDLMVYSNVTGKERSIKTLSGGESFMAALALALGMADQIQMNSSAVNLDVMFIDEGFGSLDDHSRTQAVRVLKEMAGGSKLIGIISHVSELKQEIDDQLLVKKTEDGSKIEWRNS